MPDSSWQHSVLRDLGVSQRGLAAFGSASAVLADAGWGAEAVEHSARRPSPPPAVQEPLAAPPAPPVAPQPVPAEAGQPRPYDPFPDPPQPAPAEAEQPRSYDPFPDVPQPNAPTQGSGPMPSVPERPGLDPQPNPAVQQPEPQAAEADVPLVNEEFSWDAAISPIGGSGAQAPGMPQAPGVGGDEEDGPEQDAASARPGAPAAPGPAAPVPGPPQPQPQQQAHGAGAVPMANEFVRKNQHGDALVRRVGRGVRKAVGASGQIRTQAEISDYLRRPVGGFRQITVVSVRGGAGKTTVAALLATELARHRPDRVLAMDADAELGSLPLRLGVRSELSLFDLAAQQPRSFEEAAQYLQQTREGLWVLAATRGGRITGEFTFETYQAAFTAVSRYISTAVTDCSAGILTELHRGILGQSHSVVLVTPGTVDGALSARGALEWFSQGVQRSLLPRTVIAMVSHAPQVGADLARATQMLTAWGTPVVQLPYDRQIAMGAAVDMSRLGEATQAAVSRIAYEAFARSLGDMTPGQGVAPGHGAAPAPGTGPRRGR
ncbi:MinD/ParA family protein [Actinomadura sp. 9N215]|uniref:MinD/ParA family protein n=1 Tax=Actinomadura sp. 9N215 TaxID=3375150 RepID=UPI0037A426D4